MTEDNARKQKKELQQYILRGQALPAYKLNTNIYCAARHYLHTKLAHTLTYASYTENEAAFSCQEVN